MGAGASTMAESAGLSKEATDALLAKWLEEGRLSRPVDSGQSSDGSRAGRPRLDEYVFGEKLVQEVVAQVREQEAAETHEFSMLVSRARPAVIEASLLGPKTANGVRFLPKSRVKRSGMCGLAGFACGKPGHLCGVFETDAQVDLAEDVIETMLGEGHLLVVNSSYELQQWAELQQWVAQWPAAGGAWSYIRGFAAARTAQVEDRLAVLDAEDAVKEAAKREAQERKEELAARKALQDQRDRETLRRLLEA